MTPDRESQIERICQAALDREGSARAAFLAGACAGDAALQRAVESLLAQEAAAAGFMSTPAAALGSETNGDGASFLGRHLGPYVIQSRLGAGGMGEVYRAHDTKLGRDVAIKILPRIFTSDPERLARFEREARLLASLNHPNIGAIYGLEGVDPSAGAWQAVGLALILELVEGPTLQERLEARDSALGMLKPAGLQQRALPLDEALAIARQIADALEAAHEKGIIHRDLKPANIKITPIGVVKVLDFGLAKAMTGDAAGPDSSQSPFTAGDSTEGAILGTAAYMSPGQARGRPVDKRADVWAFGCVLYEMLTGRLAFPGDTLSDTIASVLQGEPDWQALPETTPAGIRRLLRRCLEKDPTRRLRDIGDARLDIDEALTAPAKSIEATTPPPVVRRWRLRAAWALAVLGFAAAIGAPGVRYFRGTRASDLQTFRFTLPPPQKAVLTGGFALSPDGRRLVFIAARDGAPLLWVRSLDSFETHSLPGTEGAAQPIWSPDSRTVAYVANHKLNAIDVGGGSPRTLCELPGQGPMSGGSWSPDGVTIVFAMLFDGLHTVPATGGSPTALADPKATPGEKRLFPAVLPDGHHFIYLSSPSNVAWLGSLDSREPPVRLFDATSQVEYVTPGYLVFVRRGTLMAQRFDASRARLGGEAVSIVEGLLGVPGYSSEYGAPFATSLSGALVYLGDRLNVVTQLTWFNRTGRQLGLAGQPDHYRNPEISPDGKSAVMEVVDSKSGAAEIQHLEFERGISARLTSDPGNDVFPVWSPDGQWIMFSSERDGRGFQLYRIRVDGIGEERVGAGMIPQRWVSDDLLLFQFRPGLRVGLLPLSDPGARRFFDPRSIQEAGQVSPNGRWLAYLSQEAEPGRKDTRPRYVWELYVQSFPMPGPEKVQVSTNGATSPRWSRDGRELFFYDGDGQLMSVPVKSDGAAPEPGRATALFKASLLGGSRPESRLAHQFDVTADGRFLLNVPVEAVNGQWFNVVVNWQEELKR